MRSFGVGGAALAAGVLLAPTAQAGGFGASWQMNERSGPMTDASGNGNGSSSIGAGISRNGVQYSFTGKGIVTVPDSPSLRPYTKNVSVTARVKFWGGGDRNIVQKGQHTATGTQYKMEIVGNDLYCYFHGSGGIGEVIARDVVVSGPTWHLVTCRKTASAVSLIFDGRTWTKNVSVGSIGTTAPVTIGGKRLCKQCDYFVGALDYVRITSP